MKKDKIILYKLATVFRINLKIVKNYNNSNDILFNWGNKIMKHNKLNKINIDYNFIIIVSSFRFNK